MGVLELFGTLIRNDITSSAITPEYRKKMKMNHFLLDFNSIIHVSSQKIVEDVNDLLQSILKNLFHSRSMGSTMMTEKFTKLKVEHLQSKITQNSNPEDVIKLIHSTFDDAYMDKLIITLVINTVLYMIRTYCIPNEILTLMLAIDGVPSKGKMIEQKQRRYMGAIISECHRKIFGQYTDYLKGLEDNLYLSLGHSIKWNRGKITPGTAFMHKLVTYLRSEKIQTKFKVNRPQLKIVISDMYEVGEGEKKIMNYVRAYLRDTKSNVVVYSPDADMILLCMLLPVDNVFVLKYEQNDRTYNLLDVKMLKQNIAFYINNNPKSSKEQFDVARINNDIICMSTLFGNDFVPRIETINVKQGFQTLMDAYLQTLIKFKDKQYYLIKRTNGDFKLNHTVLKWIFRYLLPVEEDFVKHNKLYGEYVKLGQIKNVFSYVEVNSENLLSVYQEFRNQYEQLKHTIKQNGNTTFFEKHEQFMDSLKKSLRANVNGRDVNTSYLTNKEVIKLLQQIYRQTREFPRLNINLDTYSTSITSKRFKEDIKGMNDYDKEKFKFDNMLDEYRIKFNAGPLELTKDKIPKYYDEYFGVEHIYDPKDKLKLSPESNYVIHEYLEGLIWVFDYYFNDKSYINTWSYRHERAPLLKHISLFLDSIDTEYVQDIHTNLKKYQVDKLETFFNPIEQLIYVSPLTDDMLKILPPNYKTYLESKTLDPFLLTYFVDVKKVVSKVWLETKSNEFDCRGMPYFNKCLVTHLNRPSSADDKLFLKALRKVKANDTSVRRSKTALPKF